LQASGFTWTLTLKATGLGNTGGGGNV
jgi:hypothetical protein